MAITNMITNNVRNEVFIDILCIKTLTLFFWLSSGQAEKSFLATLASN